MPTMPSAVPFAVPFGQTARRVVWSFLPPGVRRAIERRIGTTVVEGISQTSGFTPGLASVLVGADGSRHFVKAASTKAQQVFADCYREEARKLAGLPASAPAARLLWTMEVEDWYVVGLEHVDARTPARPWRLADLERVVDVLEQMATDLTPAPADLELAPLSEETADWPGYWDHVRTSRPDLDHAADAAALAARHAEATAGVTLVHTDVRDDNVLLARDGRVLLCDWNWPTAGAAWIDTVCLLIAARGDGLDVEAVLAGHAHTRDVPADDVDVFLALLVGYFWRQGDEPVPSSSPYIRAFQRWQGDVCWDWLGERRGWGPTLA